MPNAVSCALNASADTRTFDCDPLPITLEPEDLMCVEPEAGDPGAAALVERFPTPGSTATLPATDATLPIARATKECGVEFGGVAVAILTVPENPVLAALVGLRTGVDLVQCIEDERQEFYDEMGQQAAIEDCRASGGEPLGASKIDGHAVVTCGVERRTP